jgi:hypothetical protein
MQLIEHTSFFRVRILIWKPCLFEIGDISRNLCLTVCQHFQSIPLPSIELLVNVLVQPKGVSGVSV